jgi:transcriptional regulator with XRE-family HTH domain
MDTVKHEGNRLVELIAKRIQELRLARGLTLEKLSFVTGLAKSYLSQIENCKKNPPINTLTKIAYALGEDVLTLITGESSSTEKVHFSLVRPSERRAIIHPGTALGYNYESVTYKKPDRVMDGYILTAGFKFPKEPFIHEGQELVYMLEGKQEFIYNGKKYIVEAGDCFYFDSDRPHYSRSLGNRPARFLVVFCNQRRN